MLENTRLEDPGTNSVDFWINAGKLLNRSSWNPFCRLLEARAENAYTEAPRAHQSLSLVPARCLISENHRF